MTTSYNTNIVRTPDAIFVKSGGKIEHEGQTAVTQASSISTAVTCNANTGVITTVSQTVAAGAEAEFTVNNSKVAATDVVSVCIKTHTSAGSFIAAVSAVAAGSFQIRLTNLHASTAGNNVLVLNFIVHKCAA
jgi:hypothetical protein